MYGFNPYYPGAMQRQDLIRVNGMEGANAYPMPAPGCTVPLFDANQDVMYIKSTDASGLCSLRRFRFCEEAEEKPEYMTRGEFYKAMEELKNGKQSVRKQSRNDESGE